MRRIITTLLLVAVFSPPAHPQDKDQVRLMLDGAQVFNSVGDVIFSLTLINGGHKAIGIMGFPDRKDAAANCLLSIWRDNLKITEKGVLGVRSYVRFEVGPGEQIQRHYEVNQRYHLPGKGNYKASSECFYISNGKEEKVESAIVNFTVLTD